MPVQSVRVYSHTAVAANAVGLQTSGRAQGVLWEPLEVKGQYNEEKIGGHNAFTEVRLGNAPELTVSLKGKCLNMTGVFQNKQPMHALHKSLLPIDATNDLGFETTATAGFWIYTGSLSLPNGTLSSFSGDAVWFTANPDNYSQPAAPSAP
jgi:hypothetical protein